MAHSRYTWSAGDVITAARLNNMEAQYDDIVRSYHCGFMEKVEYYDDFTDPALGAEWALSGTNYAVAPVTGVGGVMNVSMGSALNDAVIMEYGNVGTVKPWYLTKDPGFSVGLQLNNVVTNRKDMVLFYASSSTYVGLYHESAGTATPWRLRVRNTTNYDTNLSLTPVSNEYHQFCLKIVNGVGAYMYIDGGTSPDAQYTTWANFSAGNYYYFRLYSSNDEAAQKGFKLDYIKIWQSR